MDKNNFVTSIVRPISPGTQYQELNNSLVEQIQATRRNLLGSLNDRGSTMGSIDEDSEMVENKDVVPKHAVVDTDVGKEPIKVYLKIRPFGQEEIARKEDKVKSFYLCREGGEGVK